MIVPEESAVSGAKGDRYWFESSKLNTPVYVNGEFLANFEIWGTESAPPNSKLELGKEKGVLEEGSAESMSAHIDPRFRLFFEPLDRDFLVEFLMMLDAIWNASEL